MTQVTPAPRGEGVASPVELVVVTRREFYEWLDRLSAEVKATKDELLRRVPDAKAAKDKLLGRVPDDRLIAELRRRGYQITDRKSAIIKKPRRRKHPPEQLNLLPDLPRLLWRQSALAEPALESV